MLSGVLSAPLPLLAQEDPYKQAKKPHKGLRGVECTLAVIGTGGPVKRSNVTTIDALTHVRSYLATGREV
eukprot:6166646-Pyramimonas_sp.AAC.1